MSEIAFMLLGASNHSIRERDNYDYYATDPNAINKLFKIEDFSKNIWEPACGELHLSNRMMKLGKNVISTDIIDRTNGDIDKVLDFLDCYNNLYVNYDIITNPPYKYATEFVYKALELLNDGNKCAMFLRIQFLESLKRKKLFEKYPPKVVAVFSKRIKCAMNGDFGNTGSSAACYAWFIWEKGYKGDTVIKWL